MATAAATTSLPPCLSPSTTNPERSARKRGSARTPAKPRARALRNRPHLRHQPPCSTMPPGADGGLLPFLQREVAYGYLDRASGVHPGDLRGHKTREVASEVTGRWKEKGRPLREGAALHHITRTYVKQPPGATGDRLPCILRQKTRRGNPLAASRWSFEGPKELARGYL